jgi:DNA-binding IclR family transcriptional regulator
MKTPTSRKSFSFCLGIVESLAIGVVVLCGSALKCPPKISIMFSMENKSFSQVNGTRDPSSSPAVSKAVRILEYVSARRTAGISEIARETGLGKSTVHGLVTALASEGLLTVTGSGRGFALGPRMIEFGRVARDQVLMDTCEAVVADLSRETGETAFLGRVEGERVRILVRCESDRSLSLSAPVGSTIPVLAGALGKAYLATMDAGRAQGFLQARTLLRHTEQSITSRHAYGRDADRARRDGFAEERGEYLPGIAAAAAAFDWAGDTYIVWIVGIDSVLGSAGLASSGERVRSAVEEITSQLSGGERRRERSAS